MKNNYKTKIFISASKHWGQTKQMIAAAEEFSEASAALLRVVNEKVESFHEVIEELADAEIMCEQMRYYFSEVEIDRVKKMKLEKLAEKLGVK